MSEPFSAYWYDPGQQEENREPLDIDEEDYDLLPLSIALALTEEDDYEPDEYDDDPGELGCELDGF